MVREYSIQLATQLYRSTAFLYHLYKLKYANNLVVRAVYTASKTVNSFKASITVHRQ